MNKFCKDFVSPLASKCTIPFDFTIGSICVLGTLSLAVIGFLIMFGLGFILELIKVVIRKIFK